MTAAALARTLILMRHAHAQSHSPDGDHERDLSGAGEHEAASAGAWLHGHDIGIDEVLCSSAERARQTAAGVWAGGCAEADVRIDPRLYNAAPAAILEVIREADEDADVLLVIGHVPGIPALASLLADGDGSAKAHEALSAGFPTAAMAILRYSGAWSDLGPGSARLHTMHASGRTRE